MNSYKKKISNSHDRESCCIANTRGEQTEFSNRNEPVSRYRSVNFCLSSFRLVYPLNTIKGYMREHFQFEFIGHRAEFLSSLIAFYSLYIRSSFARPTLLFLSRRLYTSFANESRDPFCKRAYKDKKKGYFSVFLVNFPFFPSLYFSFNISGPRQVSSDM